MKTLKKILPITLLIISIIFIGSSCNGDDGPKKDKCDFAISYTIDGVEVTHTESVVTSEIWPGDNYPINRKVYDIWTDETPMFNFHTSASAQDETSGHVGNWQNEVGTTLLNNAVGLKSNNLTFKILKEANDINDLVKISFSGTTTDGKVVENGLICTYIDIKH